MSKTQIPSDIDNGKSPEKKSPFVLFLRRNDAMIRILLAVAVTAVSLVSATVAAFTLILWPPVFYFLTVLRSIFLLEGILIIHLEGGLIDKLHFGLSVGAAIAIPAGLSAMIFNLGHPSWLMWLRSNAFILVTTTAIGSLVYALLLLFNPIKFPTGIPGFPTFESIIRITTIATSGLTSGLLWYREQLRRARGSSVIKDITTEKPA